MAVTAVLMLLQIIDLWWSLELSSDEFFNCVNRAINFFNCTLLVMLYVFLLLCRSTMDSVEERKLLQCLRKSVLSPYKKQVVCVPPSSVADRGSFSPLSKMETRPHNKGISSKLKLSPRRVSPSKTRSSPRRSTPSKRAVAKAHVHTPLRKTKHSRPDDRKRTGLTPRRTPSKKRSQTPRKSTKRTPAKGMLRINSQILACLLFQLYAY